MRGGWGGWPSLSPNLSTEGAPLKLVPFDFAQGRLWAGVFRTSLLSKSERSRETNPPKQSLDGAPSELCSSWTGHPIEVMFIWSEAPIRFMFIVNGTH